MPNNNGKPGSRPALSDASNRANQSPVRPPPGTIKAPPNGSNKIPSFAEFLAISGHEQGPTSAAQPPQPPTTKATTTAPRSAAPPKGKKRKAERSLEEDIAEYKQDLDELIDPDSFAYEGMPTCTVVRKQINKLLDSGVIMKKGEFAKTIGVTSASLDNFLRSSGTMGGAGSNTYGNAWVWFRQREAAGIKMPDVKRRQREAEAAADITSSSSSGPKVGRTATAGKTGPSLPDISGVYLPDEEDDDVPVWDTCDEVRRKINAHLRLPGLTQAQFCRDIYAQLQKPKCKSIQSKQLADFRAMRGARTGAKSSVFYAAYVYFEKLRIAGNKPKTQHRQDMEEIWPAGMERDYDHRTSYIVLAGERPPYCDQYGMVRMV
ncbi:hypothetical protein F5Y16DRAFT_411932 [Xylariaceae sp. FL0255]|nr:hypothetical protein F5Y16DRAFT_411932 [Xylariaceae sp. FL0255]